MKLSKSLWDLDLTFGKNLILWCVAVQIAVVVNFAVATQIPIFTLPCWIAGTRCLIWSLFQRIPKWQSYIFSNPNEGATYEWKVPIYIFIFYLCAVIIFGLMRGVDTDNQWNQALTGCFNDWHPVIHTFFFWLASKVYKSQYAVWTLQTICFSFAGGWLHVTLRRIGVRRNASRLVFVLVVFSPVAILAFLSILKDAAFAISVLCLTLALVNIDYSNGKWLTLTRNKLLFVVVVLLASFIRHNGFFFAVPAALAILFMCNKNFFWHGLVSVAIAITLCLSYVLLRHNLAQRNLITLPSSQRYIESIGVPIAIIGNVMVGHPDSLSEDTRAFCEKLAPISVWRMHFKGCGNSIKDQINFKYLTDKVAPREFIRLLSKIVREDPNDAIKGFVKVTGIGWNPIPEHVPAKRFNSGQSAIRTYDLYALCNLAFHQPLGWVLASPGFAFITALLFGVYGWLRFGFRKFMIIVPILMYNIGTSLLMYDDGSSDFRFFYAIELTYPIIVLCCTYTSLREG